MNASITKHLIAFTTGFFLNQSVHAAILVNTTFDHGASDIAGNAGTFTSGTGWESGSGNVRYESSVTAAWGGDSDYVLLPPSTAAGGSMFALSASTNGRRGMQLDMGSSLTGSFWVGALMRVETGSDDTSVGNILAFENGPTAFTGADGAGFGLRGDGQLISMAGGTNNSVTTLGTDFDRNVWYLFLAKISLNPTAGGQDSLNLWVFDASSSFAPTEAGLGTATYSTSSIQFGDSIQDVWFGAYKGNGGSGGGSLDNLRVSTLGTDIGLQEVLVVPEPGTFVLLGLALGALALFHRRR